MKNKFTILSALFLLLTVGFGCSYIDQLQSGGNSSNSTTTTSDSNSNSAINPNDAAKTGVAECDEFLDLLNNDQKKPDEDIFSRKLREYIIDLAKETVKKNIEENKGDKTKIAKGCREAKDDYLKKKDEKNKKEQKESEKSSNSQSL